VPPTFAPGKIAYIQIPSLDVDRAAGFYEAVFGWNVRRSSNGEVAFDDTVGEVSGTWITGRPSSSEPGLLIYMLVESVERTLELIRDAGGELVTPLTPQGEGEAFATFRDPDGNVLGIFQQP
jgi:predicted enzyme related to lactoylglutathione lyase